MDVPEPGVRTWPEEYPMADPVDALIAWCHAPRSEWAEAARPVFTDALKARYSLGQWGTEGRRTRPIQLRINGNLDDKNAPYAGVIGPDQETSKGYGGMSFVVFPADRDGTPAMFGLVVGTNGLPPDEAILGRPGHARRVRAIARWLNATAPAGGWAWAKHDPVRIDLPLPAEVSARMEPWRNAREKYGPVCYALVRPPDVPDPAWVRQAFLALLDLAMEERQFLPKKGGGGLDEAEVLRGAWQAQLMPEATDSQVLETLASRRYVIVEGPPGTGKTEQARRILEQGYGGRGTLIQFHPAITYERFVGGLAPRTLGGAVTFEPRRGALLDAIHAARDGRPHLLVIDEVNRADLAKVLGEAIYLLEPGVKGRSLELAWPFPDLGPTVTMPPNLHILGTMNSADRSIAILDVAIRRRFAFLKLWPQREVVKAHAGDRMLDAFDRLVDLFVQYATDEALGLLPGHAYFLASDAEAPARLSTGLRPLLEEYLAQGYVSGFGDEVRAYLDTLAAPLPERTFGEED